MKKFILSAIAAVLVITVSAFTINSKLQTKIDSTTDLYWYEVVGNAIDHNAPINNGSAISKEELLENPEEYLPCTVGEASDCVRGFSTPQFSDVTDPGEQVIMKNN